MKKIVVLILAIVLIVGGILFWQSQKTPTELTGKEYVASLYQNENQETLPANIKIAYETLQQDLSKVDPYMTLGLWQRDQNKLTDAIKLYKMALEIRPTDTLLLMNLADLYKRNEQYLEAEAAYKLVIETNPKWISAYRELTDLYRYNLQAKRGEIPQILSDGLKANPEVGESYFVGPIAVYYKDFGTKEQAIEWYEKLIKLEPTNETARAELTEIKNR